MSRIITFSRYIQCADGSHRKQPHIPTYFVEQVLNSLVVDYVSRDYYWQLVKLNPKIERSKIEDFWYSLNNEMVCSKLHTIRSPKKSFKVGDKFTPAIWTAKPYSSPQIKFLDDIEVKQVMSVDISMAIKKFHIDGIEKIDKLTEIAENDGLSENDFCNWFGENGVKGQIICWDSQLKY